MLFFHIKFWKEKSCLKYIYGQTEPGVFYELLPNFIHILRPIDIMDNDTFCRRSKPKNSIDTKNNGG